MRNGILHKKIPTLFALIVLLGGIGLSILFMNNTTSLIGQASPQNKPQNIRITNTNDTGFTVTYTTDAQIVAGLSYGTDPQNLAESVVDETSSTIHVLNVTNLSPNTTYYYTITSGSEEFSDNGTPFSTTTGPTLSAGSQEQMVSGKILNADGTDGANTLVFLTAEGANALSTQTASDGTFRINAALLRTVDLSSPFSADNQTLDLLAVTNLSQAAATFLLSEGNPLPPLTLSQTYNFSAIDSPSEEPSSDTVAFPDVTSKNEGDVSITSPTSKETFSDQQPEFDGTALPNAEVEIIIQSENEIQETIKADSNGNWSYRPQTPLEPGNHTITVRSRDENGILRILTRQFTVYAEGSQFTQPSVSPGQPTQTPSPTQRIVATTTLTQTLTPTQSVITATITPTATFSPTPQSVSEPSPSLTPRPTVTPTGSNSSSILAIMSLGVFLTGTLLIVLTKMKSL